LKGNSNSHGSAVEKGIKGSNLAEVVFNMKNPGIAGVRGKAAIDEVNRYMLKWAGGLNTLKKSRS
jgi:hypothetical protein